MWSYSERVKNHKCGSNSRPRASLKSSLYLALVVPLIAACASHQPGPQRPIAINDEVAWMLPYATPPLSSFYGLSAAAQAAMRNEIVTTRMYIADMEYNYYEARLTREMQDEGLLATATNLGLTTSATLVPAAQTKTILSGIATAVTGLDKAYNEKELLSNTIQALEIQMRADRKTQAATIYSRMFKDPGTNTIITPITQYTLPAALSDTERYYQAGTVPSALVGLNKTVSIAEHNADTAKDQAGPNGPQVTNSKSIAVAITAATTIVPSPNVPLSAGRPKVIVNTGTSLVEFETHILPATIRRIQKHLCVKVDGDLGPSGSVTRHAIADYFEKINKPRVETINEPRMLDVLTIANPQGCQHSGN